MRNFKALWALLLLCTCICLSQIPASPEPAVELTLQKAFQIALSSNGNTDVQLAAESVNLSRSRYTEVRAGLLPNVDGSVTEQNQIVNLRALGLRFRTPPGFAIPTEVGPFYTFDARMTLKQSVLDLSSIRHSQAAHVEVHAAEAERGSVRERVAGAVARLYAAALRAQADVETAKTNVSLAQALRDLAANRQLVGEGTELDVTRANLSVSRNQQRLLAAQTVLTRANLELINALNVDWNTTLHLAGSLGSGPAKTMSPEEAMEIAIHSRADLQAERHRLQSARLHHSAAQLERLPSLIGYAEYGLLSGVAIHTAGATLRLPLFDGGRLESARAQAASMLRQEEIWQHALKNQVELQVRQALATLASAQSQIQVAEHAVALAQDELGRARRRYEAGLANSLEVMDSETRLENARNDQVTAQFNCTEANIDLAQAMGTIMTINF